MKYIVTLLVLTGLVAGCATDSNTPSTVNMSHAHIQHVNKSWKDTPNKTGFMETAIDEAKIAIQHAGFAAKKPDDLTWMKLHIGHVMHAVDPSTQKKGPGLGYGVIKASNGIAKHIRLAADSPEADDHLKLHSVHVATSAENTAKRGAEILQLSDKVMDTRSTATAAKLVAKINLLAQQLLDGEDANGDGKITWQAGEGGLFESQKHLGFIVKHAGL